MVLGNRFLDPYLLGLGPGGGWRSKKDPFGLKIEHQHVVIRPFLMKLHVAKVCAKGAQTRRPGHFPLGGTRVDYRE